MINPESAGAAVREVLRMSLLEPCADFLGRPGKGFRGQLLQLACRLAASDEDLTPEQKRRCKVATTIIEKIHAGALIIDDIQDGSLLRRNAMTLHLKYGMPRALNAGNWLYFEPLTLLKQLELGVEAELSLYRDCSDTLANAHFGQALDLGRPIDELEQADVFDLCMSSLEWKTGALMELALRMGAYAAGAEPEVRERLGTLGCQLGVALQMFDDAGNFSMSRTQKMAPKRHEDLYLKRPSWLWAYAAKNLSKSDYNEWLEAVSALPNETPLNAWSDRLNFATRVRAAARDHLYDVISQIEEAFAGRTLAHRELRQLATRLENAYV